MGDGLPPAPLLRPRRPRRGRRAARAPLRRPDNPRILGAFNEPTPDWLSFFFFTYFTDRDGKYQLASLRESAFDPLSRTCDFMLKEEAHHMFVGATGRRRVVQRTVELMKEHDTDDVGPYGGVDVATLQRYLNFHYSVSLDLFGAETSTNAANYFAAGLKGRFQEERRARRPPAARRHRRGVRSRPTAAIGEREAPALTRSTRRCATTTSPTAARASTAGTARWPRSASSCAAARRLQPRGRRSPDHRVSPDGRLVDDAEWAAAVDRGCRPPTTKAHVESLMRRHRAGRMAGWVAPPSTGDPPQAGRLRVRPRRQGTDDATTRRSGCSIATSRPATATPGRPARGESTTYADLQRQVCRAQRTPWPRSASGAATASRWSSTTSRLPAWFLGALRSGIVPVPLSTMLTGDELAAVVADARCRGSSWCRLRRPRRADRRRRRRATPSSSARPPTTGVRPTHAWATFTDAAEAPVAPTDGGLAGVLALHLGHDRPAQGRDAPARQPAGDRRDLRREVLGIGPDDRCLSVAKLFFAYGLGNSLTFPFSVGATAILNPDPPTPAGASPSCRGRAADAVLRQPGFVAALLDADLPGRPFASVRRP